ncbi:unnamed protein product [Amoebophrya sp. A120]|nr:unnamed protein product [Amoebophrya sp. A120]|eukprot:GSA120T00007690001.1
MQRQRAFFSKSTREVGFLSLFLQLFPSHFVVYNFQKFLCRSLSPDSRGKKSTLTHSIYKILPHLQKCPVAFFLKNVMRIRDTMTLITTTPEPGCWCGPIGAVCLKKSQA